MAPLRVVNGKFDRETKKKKTWPIVGVAYCDSAFVAKDMYSADVGEQSSVSRSMYTLAYLIFASKSSAFVVHTKNQSK